MQIRAADIPPEGVLLEERLEPRQLKDLAALQEKGICGFRGQLAVRLQVIPFDQMFEVTGTIQTVVTLQCGRCLASMDSLLEESFKLTFAPAPPEDEDRSPEEAHALRADEMGLVFFEGEAFSFQDTIQEQVIMAIPMQPLCREDCRGLCPRCGVDRNKTACDCHDDAVDPRLAVLKNLKIDS